jgi:ABC-type sugar transport system permease subunit
MATIVSTRGTRGGHGGSWWTRHQRAIAPYLFISPFFILFLVFGLYPIAYSFWLSFFKGFGFAHKAFFGLGNYAHLFQDARYLQAVANTTYYALGSVFVLSPLALILALAINSYLVRWPAFYKTAFFFPAITSSVVIAIIFSRVFDTQFGLLNVLLGWFHAGPVGWLTDQQVVMPSFIIMGIWTYTGITALYWLAGLNGISAELYEAARVDGAGRWRVFWSMTLPLLRPVTMFVIIQAIIGSYNLFAQPLLLTNGGPADASLTISLYLYNQAFENFNVGYASAIAYSMVAFLAVLSILNIVVFKGYNTTD